MKAIEQYVHVVLFIMLYKAIRILKAVLTQVVSQEIENKEQNQEAVGKVIELSALKIQNV